MNEIIIYWRTLSTPLEKKQNEVPVLKMRTTRTSFSSQVLCPSSNPLRIPVTRIHILYCTAAFGKSRVLGVGDCICQAGIVICMWYTNVVTSSVFIININRIFILTGLLKVWMKFWIILTCLLLWCDWNQLQTSVVTYSISHLGFISVPCRSFRG